MRLIRTLAAVALVAACNAVGSSAGFGVGPAEIGPTAPAFDASVNGGELRGAACPASPPDVGLASATCDPKVNGARCEYGDGSLPSCNDIYVCSPSEAVWTETHMAVDASACSACPAAFEDLVPGGPCEASGAICSYVEATCGCTVAEGADAGGDADPDAGAGSSVWTCTRPAAGCPARRPRIGATCVHEMTCDYGSCLFGADLAFACAQVSPDVFAWKSVAAQPCP
jgi:hypothetical protein